jgi:calcineurin-like phosphoesterase family protein
MAGRVFVIADLHFGHAKAAAARGFASTDAHDRHIIEAWNRVVDKRDVVYVLGDVFRLDCVGDLNGIKKIAMGNHDTKPVVAYAALFSKVAAYFEYDGCLLSHIPVHESQRARFRSNVHGHTHANRINDPWYVPVSVEQLEGGAPVLLNDLIARKVTT